MRPALGLLLVAAGLLSAQETPTERDAARGVVAKMDSLERSLNVTAMVARLAAPNSAREQVAADSRDLELLGRLESSAERWQAANIRHRDGLVLPKGLLLTEAVDLMRRWGTELPGAVLDFIKRSRSVAKRRRMRRWC